MADETYRYTWSWGRWPDAVAFTLATDPWMTFGFSVVALVVAVALAVAGSWFAVTAFLLAVVFATLPLLRRRAAIRLSGERVRVSFSDHGILSEGVARAELPWSIFTTWRTRAGHLVLQGRRVGLGAGRVFLAVPLRAIDEDDRPALFALISRHLAER